MKVQGYKCDSCEEFGNDFQISDSWFTLIGGQEWHFCSIACLQNWSVNDAWRIP